MNKINKKGVICAICKNDSTVLILTLGHQPPSDAFLTHEKLEAPEVAYPLDVFFCPQCTLVQLGYAVDPEILFRDYVYNSGTNNSLKKNFSELVEHVVKTYHPTQNDLAIDIGSNDGTLLENYLPHKVKILGIDPSSSTSLAIEKGIPTIVDFFNTKTANDVAQKYGTAKIITATNVFAHVVDIQSFMEGVLLILDDDGVFITESSYIVDTVEGMQYDSIYHEHLRYYSVQSLVTLFGAYGMEIINVEHIEMHGGSIRVTASKKGRMPQNASVNEFLEQENKNGYHDVDVYKAFATRVAQTKFALLDIIFTLKKNGSHIVGVGAPAKGNTLLNYTKIDSSMIDYLTEKSPLKIGLFSPGMHIPVVDESVMFEEQPDYALLLSWNIATELKQKLRAKGFKGKFILPNPIPQIIED